VGALRFSRQSRGTSPSGGATASRRVQRRPRHRTYRSTPCTSRPTEAGDLVTAAYRTPAAAASTGPRYEFTFDGAPTPATRTARPARCPRVTRSRHQRHLGRREDFAAGRGHRRLVQIEAPFPEPMLLASTGSCTRARRPRHPAGPLLPYRRLRRYDAMHAARRTCSWSVPGPLGDGGADRRRVQAPSGGWSMNSSRPGLPARRHRTHRDTAASNWYRTGHRAGDFPEVRTPAAHHAFVITTTASCWPSSGAPITPATLPLPGCRVSGVLADPRQACAGCHRRALSARCVRRRPARNHVGHSARSSAPIRVLVGPPPWCSPPRQRNRGGLRLAGPRGAIGGGRRRARRRCPISPRVREVEAAGMRCSLV